MYKVSLTGSIRWLISEEDPIIHTLQCLENWVLVNPLVYDGVSQLRLGASGTRREMPKIPLLGERRTLVQTSTLMFVIPDQFDLDSYDIHTLFNKLVAFVKGLRHVSKQAELSKAFGISVAESFEIPDLEIPNLPSPSTDKREVSEQWLNEYWVNTSVTWEQISTADLVSIKGGASLADALLLDSINALIDQDYRRGLLYAAISVEALAATKLDEAYGFTIRAFDESDMDTSKFRMIQVTQAGNSVRVIDPVYEYLSKRTEFRLLLHERPLYLLGRSVLLEDESLYREIIRLYKTRNNIAHRGELVEDNGDLFRITLEDASAAVACAIRLFEWFGEPAQYHVPGGKFRKLSQDNRNH